MQSVNNRKFRGMQNNFETNGKVKTTRTYESKVLQHENTFLVDELIIIGAENVLQDPNYLKKSFGNA